MKISDSNRIMNQVVLLCYCYCNINGSLLFLSIALFSGQIIVIVMLAMPLLTCLLAFVIVVLSYRHFFLLLERLHIHVHLIRTLKLEDPIVYIKFSWRLCGGCSKAAIESVLKVCFRLQMELL